MDWWIKPWHVLLALVGWGLVALVATCFFVIIYGLVTGTIKRTKK